MRPRSRLAGIVALGLAGIAAAVLLLLRGGPGDPEPVSESTPGVGADVSLDEGQEPDVAAPEAEESPAREAVRQVREMCFLLGGEPAAATEVFLLPWSEEIQREAASQVGLRKDVIAAEAARHVSDASGRLAVELPVPPFFVAARAPGSAPFGRRFDSWPESITLDLPLEERLRGIVVNTLGGPTAGAVVLAYRAFRDESNFDGVTDDEQRFAGMFFESRVAVGLDGRFDLGGLPAARIYAIAYAQGLASDRRADFVLPSGDLCELLLRPAVTVRGRVIAAESELPIAGAQVSLYQRNGPVGIFEQEITVTDRAGLFELRAAYVGTEPLSFRVVKQGYAALMERVERSALARGEGLVLRLLTAHPVEGTVRSQAGEPLPDVWVQVHEDVTLDLIHFTKSGEGGRFLLDFVAPGRTYTLIGSGYGYYVETYERLDLCAQENLEIVLMPQPALRGRAVVPDYPLRNGRARLVQEDEAGNRLEVKTADIDADTGEFEFKDLVTMNYLLDVAAEGYAPARVGRVGILDPPEKNEVEIALQRGATLRGRVFDRGTGKAVIGAAIALADVNLGGHALGALPLAAESTTDGEGNYVLEHVPTGAPLQVTVDHPDYALEHPDLLVDQGGLFARLDVGLRRGATVTMTIADEQGERFSVLEGAAYSPDGAARYGRESGGVLRFERLPPGKTIVDAGIPPQVREDLRHRHFVREMVLAEGEERAVAFSLAGGARIHGVAGGPGLCNRFRRISIASRPVEGSDTAFDLWTEPDEKGRYVLPGVPPGRRSVWVEPDDVGSGFKISKVVDVTPGADIELDFYLPLSGIEGAVTRADGSTIVGALVEVRPWDQAKGAPAESADFERQEAKSTQEGRYFLAGVKQGTYGLAAEAEGFGRVEDVVTVPDEETVLRRDVVLEPEALLEVLATDRGGAPLAEVECSARRAGGSWSAALPVRKEWLPERRVFFGAASGEYLVRAAAEGFFPAEVQASCRSGQTTNLTIALRRRGVLRVKVITAAGAPARSMPLEVIDVETGTSAGAWLAAGLVTSTPSSAVTDEKGELRLDGLPEGQFRVSGLGVTVTARVAAGEEAGQVTLMLPQ
ncbi:MAG: carboxypeptidase regulatory-like domain-containing protein [Planctomycetes bacterium]|nr:carboxypeptidase regulatory-like domain-containing protein [Planctomycetota bacterium]